MLLRVQLCSIVATMSRSVKQQKMFEDEKILGYSLAWSEAKYCPKLRGAIALLDGSIV